MVSPIQTWRHREPKGLWAGLGSLAIVAHAGILGFSLPYLLDIAQPAGEDFATSTPVQLIEVDPTDERSTATPSQATEDPTTQTPERPTNLTEPSPTRPAAIENSQTPASGSNSPETNQTTTRQSDNGTQDEQRSGSEDSGIQDSGSENSGSENPGTEDSGSGDSSTEAHDIQDPGTQGSDSEAPSESESNTEDTGDSTPEDSSNNPSEGNPSEPDVPPVVPGGPSLPAPGGGGEPEKQQTYLSVIGDGYVPENLQRDLTDTPPAIVYGGRTTLDASPQDLGCGRVDFSQPQVTYRVTISPEGSLISAIPWTNSIEAQPMTASEQAIACLLESADFSFTPALQDGSPVASSNLLLTIEVVESGVD